jgi:hypothetical protein
MRCTHYQKRLRLQERRNRCIDSPLPHMQPTSTLTGVQFPEALMAVPGHPSLFISAGIAALIGWRLVSRVRRMVGRQRLSTVRPWLTVCLVPVVLVGLLIVALAHPWVALALVAGVAIGVALGLYGLRLTIFEPTAEGLFYTPNAYLGIALSLLLIVRLGWRAVELYTSEIPIATPPVDFARSPLTLLIVGTLAGYYITYAVGLLRWRRQVASSPLDT